MGIPDQSKTKGELQFTTLAREKSFTLNIAHFSLKQIAIEAGKIIWWVKVPSPKADSPSSIPETHMRQRERKREGREGEKERESLPN